MTLKKIAEEAGVSYQTVWRALHDAPGILPSTRDDILRIAAKNGYRANKLASSLRTKRTMTLGIVMHDLGNPFLTKIIDGIETEARTSGYSMMLMGRSDTLESERRHIGTLIERQVDGIIISSAPTGNHSYLRKVAQTQCPIVAINHRVPGFKCPTIAVQNADAGRMAAQRFVEKGHRIVAAIFGPLENTSNKDRHDGFVSYVKATHGVRAKAEIGENSVDFARQSTRSLFSGGSPPSALFTSTYLLTEGALIGLRELGISRSRTVEVLGFDVQYAHLLDPPLSVFIQPAFEIGVEAVRSILAIIHNRVEQSIHALSVRLSDHRPDTD